MNITTYLPYLSEADRMLNFMLDNGETLTDAEIKDKLALMESLQTIQTKLAAVEKRMRVEIAAVYSCELGKSKTNTDKAVGFKIEVKRPLDVKIDPEADIAAIEKEVGLNLDAVFKIKREFSATGFKELSEGQQDVVNTALIRKEGSLSVKVTKIIQ